MKLVWQNMTHGVAERWAAVATLAVLLTGGVLEVQPGSRPSQIYSTRTGEKNAIRLEDASLMELNTRTHLEWSADGQERRATLTSGEAYFEVRPDAGRPFRVDLAQSSIQVLGTRFDVYQKANGHVRVTVLEGEVLVQGHEGGSDRPAWHRELYANQRIEYGPEGVIEDVTTSRFAAGATMWREGVAEFNDVLLPEALDELSRYTDHRIVIQDARLREVHLSGVVSIRDVRVTLRRLEVHAPIAVTEEGNTFTLRYREHDR